MNAASPLLLAIDQGTSATKCVLVDESGSIVARGSAPLGETHPHPGWVEQDATAIWDSVREAVHACVRDHTPSRIVAAGISSQRESVVAWDRRSGAPLAPLVSWQDQRTASLCDALRTPENEALVRERSGLPLDPMFSAAKMAWLLDEHDPKRELAKRGTLCLGTVDSWLLFRLTGAHLIEAGNASRTQLLDTARLRYDEELLALFDVPRAALPEIVPSSGPFPAMRGLEPFTSQTTLAAVMADSHAALFAHGAFEPGSLKVTYGTGSSIMGLLPAPKAVGPSLCLTVAWQTDTVRFAAEGNIRATGAALRWLADLLGISPQELIELGAAATSDGIAFVPAFSGLGAPYWDHEATGLLTGLTQKSGRAEVARAAMEAIVQQITDVVDAFDREVGHSLELFADGGPTRSDVLMQMQADVTRRPVLRSRNAELSALGVAHLAGLAANVWSWDAVRQLPRERDTFEPACDGAAGARLRATWQSAIARARYRPANGALPVAGTLTASST